MVSLNKALLGPYFLGGVALGGSPYIAMNHENLMIPDLSNGFTRNKARPKGYRWFSRPRKLNRHSAVQFEGCTLMFLGTLCSFLSGGALGFMRKPLQEVSCMVFMTGDPYVAEPQTSLSGEVDLTVSGNRKHLDFLHSHTAVQLYIDINTYYKYNINIYNIFIFI